MGSDESAEKAEANRSSGCSCASKGKAVKAKCSHLHRVFWGGTGIEAQGHLLPHQVGIALVEHSIEADGTIFLHFALSLEEEQIVQIQIGLGELHGLAALRLPCSRAIPAPEKAPCCARSMSASASYRSSASGPSAPSSNLADFYRERQGTCSPTSSSPITAGAASRPCASAGWPTWRTPSCARLCRSTRPRRCTRPCSTSYLLTSMHFDSRTLLSVILAGDARLTAKLRREELLPLGSRIRTRLDMEYASREVLIESHKHLQNSAGNASLMSAEMLNTLAEHALGNYRVLTTMAAELLATAAQHERPQLDE
jgi:hypothetical protein